MRLYISGIAPETTEKGFRKHFEKYGLLETVDFWIDVTTGKAKDFAFITMRAEEAKIVLETLSGQLLDGQKIEISKLESKHKNGAI